MGHLILMWSMLCICLPLASLRADEPVPPRAKATEADRLVQSALMAELGGYNGERAKLLSQAIEVDALHQPSRWLAGYVNIKGSWHSIDEAGKPSLANPDREQYVALRAKSADDVTGHLRLAQFCYAHNLPDEARAHWLRVVALDPTNKEARERLGQKRVGDVWLTKTQIAEVQDYQRRIREADERWKPRLERLRGRLIHAQANVRKTAIKELLSIQDADAAIPLERYLAGTSQNVDTMLVELLGDMPPTEAALALARCTVVSPWADVREAAARQLQKREPATYAPLLLAAMYKPVMQHQVVSAGDGGVALRQMVTTERQFVVDRVGQDTIKYFLAELTPMPVGRRVNVNYVSQVFVQDDGTVSSANQGPSARQDAAARDRATAPMREFNARQWAAVRPQLLEQAKQLEDRARQWQDDARRAQLQADFDRAVKAVELEFLARATEKKIAQEAQQINQRLSQALNLATSQSLPAEPAVWWQWWDDYTGLQAPEKPTRAAYSSTTTVGTVWAVPTPTGPVAPVNVDQILISYISCFAPGTPVATIGGMQPIESIRIGDLVLSQDARTGELAYKPVLSTSIGKPTKFVKLTVGETDERLQCTPNHLFWVNRSGWCKANELVVGSYLHGVRGAAPIWKIEAGDTAKTYNLVVADFHSYFVGNERVLVHDNSMWEPTESLVPGMATAK